MDIGALSLVIGESGFAATMQKVGQLDAAATALGAKAQQLRITAPAAPGVQASLARLGETATAISGQPLTIRVVSAGLTDAGKAIAGLEAEKERLGASPVVIPVAPPNVGPATTALSALAEAQAIQAQRAALLTEALTVAGNAATTNAERAQVLRSALEQDNAATAALSESTLQLDRRERDGVEVMQLRTQAVNELRIAQEALTRAQSATPIARPSVASAANPIPTLGGVQLGPATPAAEEFARRTAATVAGFEAQTLAAAKARAEIEAYEENARRAGNTTQALSPKLRSAANGLTAVGFALTATGGSAQSMAMGLGLAATSLASMASGPIALWATGIGAALTIGVGFIAMLDRMTTSAANTATAFDEVNRSISQIRSVSEAQAQLAIQTRKVAEAEQAVAAAKQGFVFDQPLQLGSEIANLVTLEKVLDRQRDLLKAAQHQAQELGIRDATEMQASRIRIATEGTAAENRALEAASRAFLAGEQAKFATGRASLDKFFDERLAAIRAGSAREVAALRQRQNLLALPVAGATPAQSAERAAEIGRIETQIRETQARTTEQTRQAIEERRQQREQLDRTIIGFEQKEQEAAGDASAARIAMAKIEAQQIARTLVQRSGATTPDQFAKAWVDANTAAQQYVETQTQIIRFQQLQTESQRVFSGLEREREAIQRRVAQGEITELEGNRQIAAAERARIPALEQIAASMTQFATDLKNPELLEAAKRLGAAIQGLKLPKLTVAEEWVRDIKNDIERQFQLLELLLKPKNIILSGVQGALQQLNQNLSGLALGIGNSIGNALGAGFSSAFTKGSGKNFVEAAGNAFLTGVGGLLVQLGSSMVAYAAIMAVAAPLLVFSPFAQAALSAPAAAIAGTALIALGAGMGAIAANNTGTRTGGGSAAKSATAAQPRTSSLIFDPDQRIRDRAAARTVSVSERRAAAPLAPVTFNAQFFGTPNSEAVRFVADATRIADGRNIKLVRKRG